MQDNYYIVFPILIFMLTALICLYFSGRMVVQRVVSLSASLLALCCSAKLLILVDKNDILSLQVGGWEAPFGITVVADRLSAMLVCITCLLSFAVSIYAFSGKTISKTKKQAGFYPSLFFMLAGIIGSFITGDLFNLYVWFEVMLISSFVLITLGSERNQLQGGLKYVTFNFVASSFLLLSIGILYGVTGRTNLAALGEYLQQPGVSATAQLASVLLLVSFSAKAAMFPLFFWLPASYHTPPIAIISVVAGLLTKVGVYTLIRTYTLLFPLRQDFINDLLFVMACCTMLIGVIGAIAQSDIRKILSYNLISKIGFMIMGLAVYTPLALGGAIFYMVHHILVKTNLFFICGFMAENTGSYDIRKLNGLYDKMPFISFIFMILSLTLIGIPPFSGFWGKLMLVQGSIGAGIYVPAAFLLVTSILTLYSMMRVWHIAYLREGDGDHQPKMVEIDLLMRNKNMVLAVLLLLSVTLTISFYAAPLVDFSIQASKDVLNPSVYINQVLTK